MSSVALLLALLHPQTAPNINNRYIKLTLMEDRVRLAYTVLFGDLPAETERLAMDKDGDRAVSESEARQFGDSLGKTIAGSIHLTIDGAPIPLRWDSAEVGLGANRAVAALPFSIDLVATFPLRREVEHEVRLDDRFEPPRLGETEILLEEAPGTRVTASWTGRESPGIHGLKWLFSGPRASDLEDRSVGFRYLPSRGASAPSRRTLPWPLLYGGGGLLVAIAFGLGLRYARRKRATSAASRDTRSPSSPVP